MVVGPCVFMPGAVSRCLLIKKLSKFKSQVYNINPKVIVKMSRYIEVTLYSVQDTVLVQVLYKTTNTPNYMRLLQNDFTR